MTEYAQEPLIEEQETADSSSNKGLNVLSVFRTFKRKAWLIAGITSITTIAASVSSAFQPNSYVGNFYLLVEPITSAAKLTDPTTLTRTGGVPKEDLFALDYPTNLAFLRSPGMTYRIAKDVHDQKAERAIPAIWKDLRDNLKVERLGTTQATATKIFEVSYQGENPQEVQAILDTAAQTFLKYSAEDRETSLKAGVSFIDKQLPELIQRLNRLQTEQQKLRQEYDLLDPSSKGQAILEQIKNIETQQVTVNNELEAQRALYENLAQQLKLTPQEALAASTLSQDVNRAALATELQKIDTQIAIESARFTSESPVLQTLKEQRANLAKLFEQKTQQLLSQNSSPLSRSVSSIDWQNPTRLKLIDQYIDASNQIRVLEVRRQSLAKAKISLEGETRNYPEMIRNYQEIERKIVLTTQLLDRLQTQRETLRVEAAQELPWQLISKPQIPLDKDGKPISYPPDRKKKIFAGVAGGLLSSALLAILLEKRRNKFYTSDDLQDFLPGLLVGSIPWDGMTAPETIALLKPSHHLEQPAAESKGFSTLTEALQTEEATATVTTLVETQAPPLPLTPQIAEGSSIWGRERSYPFVSAFDIVYTQLCLLNNNRLLRSIAVSSVEPDDGQTTIAIYLANAAARNGLRVLIVDANWHNPQLHDCFNLPNDQGLYHLLTHSLHPSEVVQAAPETENLFVLTSGLSEAEPRKRLWSPKMKELMEKLEQEYDFIVYDLPHFFDSTEISFITTQTDGLLLVVGIFKTSESSVKKAINEINRLKLPFLGAIANHIQEQTLATWF